MPTIGAGITVGAGITASSGVSQSGLVLDLNSNSGWSYSPNVFAYPKDIGSWMVQFGANSATLSRDTSVTDSPAGGVAMKMAVSGNDPYTATYNTTTFNIAPAASGQTWTLSVYVKASVATSGELFIFGANSSGTIIDYGAGAISIGTSWTRVSYTFAFSNGSVTNVQFRLDGPNSGGAGINVWWDGAQLELGSSPTTFSPVYNPNGTSWYDTSVSRLTAAGTATYISPNTNGIVSGATWSTAATDILNTNTHSIFFMIKFNGNATYPNGYTGSWEKIFGYPAGGSDRSPGVWRYPSARYIHWRYDPNNTGIDFGPQGSNGVEFTINTWYYVGVTLNNGTATCYCNGVNNGSASVSYPKTAGNSAVYLFDYYTNPLANLNNLLVYNRVLSNAEVSQNFNVIRSLYGI